MIFKKPNKARYRNELRGNKDLKTKLLYIYIYIYMMMMMNLGKDKAFYNHYFFR